MNTSFKDLVGCKLTELNIVDQERVVFRTEDGKDYHLYHSQDCCESVMVHEVIGNIDDVIGAKISAAEENVYNNENFPGHNPDKDEYAPESFTWSIFKLKTRKGSLEIRWLGTSNGYYSESVYFSEF